MLNFNCVAPYTPDEFINKNEDEFLKNEFTPLVNFIKNCIYQNSTEIDENIRRINITENNEGGGGYKRMNKYKENNNNKKNKNKLPKHLPKK